MAEIKNGFLISAKSKVAGTVLYKAKGAQLMRGIPVYPKDYVGSDAQIKARDTFGDMSAACKTIGPALDAWNSCQRIIGRRYKGTYRDGVVGRMVGNLYVDENGVPYDSDILNTVKTEVDKHRVWWAIRNMRPPLFRQFVPSGVSIVSEATPLNGAMLQVQVLSSSLQDTLMSLRKRGYPRLSTSYIGSLTWSSAAYLSGEGMLSPGLNQGVLQVKSGFTKIMVGASNHESTGILGDNAGILVYGIVPPAEGDTKPPVSVPLFSVYVEGVKLFH